MVILCVIWLPSLLSSLCNIISKKQQPRQWHDAVCTAHTVYRRCGKAGRQLAWLMLQRSTSRCLVWQVLASVMYPPSPSMRRSFPSAWWFLAVSYQSHSFSFWRCINTLTVFRIFYKMLHLPSSIFVLPMFTCLLTVFTFVFASNIIYCLLFLDTLSCRSNRKINITDYFD